MSQDNTTEPACAARDRLEVELHAAHEVIKQLRAEIADLKDRIAWRPICISHRHGLSECPNCLLDKAAGDLA